MSTEPNKAGESPGGTEFDRRIRQLQRESPELLGSILRCLAEGVVVADSAGRFVLWNPAAERLVGLGPVDLPPSEWPRHYGVYLPDGETPHPAEQIPLARAIRGEEVDEHILFLKHESAPGGVWLSVSARPLVDDQGRSTGAVTVLRDVGDQRRKEKALLESHSDLERLVGEQDAELQRAEERLRESERLEAVGRLAGGVAHDFNNMLSAILGYSEMALDKLDEGHPARRFVETVRSAGEKSAVLTHQLLAFGRKQILEPRVVDLNDLVTSMLELMARSLGEDIEVSFKPVEQLGRVRVDPNATEQALMNLALNACDAMPSGGKLTVETRNVHLDEDYARAHPEVTPGKHVMLAVSDTGTGMDESTLGRIFEPFFTTKEPGQGTGLGLASVHGFVKQSGGSIWAYSEVGTGTTFKVYLPRVASPIDRPTTQMLRSPARGTETILVVEDNDLVRNLVQETLEASGYTVLAASDGRAALQICADHEAEIHLAITDVVMPGMGGREFVEALPPERRSMAVIYTSGYAENAIVHHGVLDSGVEFLQKPVTPRALVQKVRQVLDRP